MNAGLKVIQAGLQTTVQDLGRTGGQRFGIPVSGAIDPEALRAANTVVGNPQGTAGLEIALLGPTLEIAAGSARFAVAGGSAEIEVTALDGTIRRVPALQSVRLVRGERLRIGAVPGSAVACLAVAGGFDLEPFMGSLSTYTRGAFGGFDGRALRAGDVLPIRLADAEDRAELRLAGLELRLSFRPRPRIRVVLGPQDDYFTADAVRTFLSATYTVSRDADRMGLRLEGPALTHAKGYDIVSDGIAPGAIQVPGTGLPIILLADRQSTGGYPKIATVASVDLAALGRAAPGFELTFEAVTVEAAQNLRREQGQRLATLASDLAPVPAAGFDLARLLTENLVSGVVDGQK